MISIWLTLALLTVASVLMYARYRHDIEIARDRVRSSSLIETRCGTIEYATTGSGPAVLIVHGAGGGFDQGLDFAAPLASNGLKVIAMSRFGYLRTPLPNDASAEAQADAHACLLDALGIPRAAIIGVSAGAPSATQFALRHPDRCTALVLLVPAGFVPRPDGTPSLKTPPRTTFLFDTALKFDFPFWIGPKLARDTFVESILATPKEVAKAAGVAEQHRLDEVLEHILPVSERRLGLLNDAKVTQTLTRYPLEDIRTPSLLISTADDLYGTYDVARFSAEHIRGARFIGYDSGGHLFVGHRDAVLNELREFLSPK